MGRKTTDRQNTFAVGAIPLQAPRTRNPESRWTWLTRLGSGAEIELRVNVKERASDLILLASAKIIFLLHNLMLERRIIDEPDFARRPADGCSDIVHHLLHHDLIERVVHEEHGLVPC